MKKKIALVALAVAAVGVQAAEWSDTSISLRHGTNFSEPYDSNNAITKNIIGLTHASGYTYGTNFFNVDLLLSNEKDPAFKDGKTGAHEVYAVYRNTVDFEKVTGKSFKTTGVRGLGFTGGFDFNTKTDTGYNSKKEMLVLGPTVMVDVPAGFLNVSLLQLWESNAPSGWSYLNSAYYGVERYHYDAHPMLSASWAIPFNVASLPLSFEGFANYIAPKGKNEFGGDTAAETNIDMQVMYDMSGAVGSKAKTFKVGVEYQYWKNKFGNPTTATVVSGSQAGQGATARTPMVRAEYHF
ncbi:outer envelope protein [Limnohabitans curvus]|uniref:Outer envelope protein n=1 Tax=Limnohabitans curvus TaxID=323423 RepID=A0A315ERX7_9BURK|nr:outer envelope protein [Limnohabitans curvus]PUE59989.1 outer envelope protein [Limnohabitans curvus]